MIAAADRIFRKNAQIICRETAGLQILIDPYRRVMIEMNPVAGEIWRVIDGKRSAGEIVALLKNIFEVDGSTLEKDIANFLNDCIKREMIEECSAQ